jgi:predicted alpha/beta hydrolase family esterase
MVQHGIQIQPRSALILHGWHGSGPAHWQTWLAGELAHLGWTVQYPHLPDSDHPTLAAWLDAAWAQVQQHRPQTVICHSLACLLWMHLIAQHPDVHCETLLMVAPSSPARRLLEVRDFFPVPEIDLSRHATTRLIVISTNDPYCPLHDAKELETLWNAPIQVLDQAGHINVDAGYGPWPWAKDWLLSSESPEDDKKT